MVLMLIAPLSILYFNRKLVIYVYILSCAILTLFLIISPSDIGANVIATRYFNYTWIALISYFVAENVTKTLNVAASNDLKNQELINFGTPFLRMTQKASDLNNSLETLIESNVQNKNISFN